MENRQSAKNIASTIFIILISLLITVLFASLAFYGAEVRTNGEPPVIGSTAIYPNLDALGEPISYSAVIYDSQLSIEKGNAVTYYCEGSSAASKLTTAYFYEENENSFAFYSSANGEFFDINKTDYRGRAVNYVPYVGVILSLACTLPGMIVFAVIALAMLVIIALYVVSIIRRTRTDNIETQEDYDKETEEAEDTDSIEEESAEEQTVIEEEEPLQDKEENETESETEKEESESTRLNMKLSSKDNGYNAELTGPAYKIERIEKAFENLRNNKGVEINAQPIDAEPSGCVVECDKDTLPIVIALVKRLNEE